MIHKGLFQVVCNQFGYPMYAANAPTGWSDRIDEAHTYDDRDSKETKLKYWRGLAASQGLDASTVAVVEVA